jgi:hypothetical protein
MVTGGAVFLMACLPVPLIITPSSLEPGLLASTQPDGESDESVNAET